MSDISISTRAAIFCNVYVLFKFLILLVNHINKNKVKITEGKLRCDDLATYLDNVGAPKHVWISEDGSGIVAKICYDSTTNQLVGLVLPLDSDTRMPIPFSFKPKSLKDLELLSKEVKSNIVQIVMAQPIKEGVSPFILQMFGTDNKQTALDVSRRWKFTRDELAK